MPFRVGDRRAATRPVASRLSFCPPTVTRASGPRVAASRTGRLGASSQLISSLSGLAGSARIGIVNPSTSSLPRFTMHSWMTTTGGRSGIITRRRASDSHDVVPELPLSPPMTRAEAWTPSGPELALESPNNGDTRGEYRHRSAGIAERQGRGGRLKGGAQIGRSS